MEKETIALHCIGIFSYCLKFKRENSIFFNFSFLLSSNLVSVLNLRNYYGKEVISEEVSMEKETIALHWNNLLLFKV